jgi:Domain of Unknown Function with PDB structure (DUF3861)
MPAYHYRITVEKLDVQDASAGGEGLESISFFASTPHDILTTSSSLRARLDCTACHATKLAVGLGLITDVVHTHRDPALFSEPMRELLGPLESAAAKTNA